MRVSIKLLSLLAAVLVVAVVSWWLSPRDNETATAAQQQNTLQGGNQQGVPVLAGTAEARDVPIIVRGIGSVQAYNMVTVKSRVDGNIVKVAFTEGQYVHQGNLLIQIDPRPYQAQL
ncbi:MAG: biotin/lipoyl-binding protein [Planctomycetaceae bacterium]|nr:biotin/lipoyl-binding protein [Planctomycetaceae bacterium]MBV8337768.1 biotin/lipoyl-binding protein [Alphaproteobacteria bacterium]